ncbi:MAG: hypothetical protein AAF639_14830 [Chloroflexota bacterium]
MAQASTTVKKLTIEVNQSTLDKMTTLFQDKNTNPSNYYRACVDRDFDAYTERKWREFLMTNATDGSDEHRIPCALIEMTAQEEACQTPKQFIIQLQ